MHTSVSNSHSHANGASLEFQSTPKKGIRHKRREVSSSSDSGDQPETLGAGESRESEGNAQGRLGSLSAG